MKLIEKKKVTLEKEFVLGKFKDKLEEDVYMYIIKITVPPIHSF